MSKQLRPELERAIVYALFALVGVVVGVVVGKRLERSQHRKRLLNAQVHSLGDVRGVMTDEQQRQLQLLLDGGAVVLQERADNLVALILQVGGERLEKLFVVPADDTPPEPPVAELPTEEE